MKTEPIISTELPTKMCDPIITHDEILAVIQDSERAAILRFCEAVERDAKDMQQRLVPKNKSFNLALGFAMKKLRDEISRKEGPAIEDQRKSA